MATKVAKVAINGLGRIGRVALKQVMDTPELELVAVNDIGSLENMAYLLKYDTVYGRYEKSVEVEDGALIVGGERVTYLSERDPAQLPWGELGVKLVFECTGLFTGEEDARKHVEAGARWVIISAPTSSEGVPTVVHGVNRPEAGTSIISCASCTTNNVTPVVGVMNRHFGVEKALLTTIHAYTATQAIVDSPGGAKDFRRGRAAAANFVPASTGAGNGGGASGGRGPLRRCGGSRTRGSGLAFGPGLRTRAGYDRRGSQRCTARGGRDRAIPGGPRRHRGAPCLERHHRRFAGLCRPTRYDPGGRWQPGEGDVLVR